jgi:2-succinyl-5-enolpyruvyl-6-hydroxy-3-cyclohexene-1-carboxylate synthase
MNKTYHIRQGIRDLPEICARMGISEVIICPGSRNAPLIISFTAHPQIRCLSVTDERSAGYIALGIAQYSKKPVAVVCTSGTAVLNMAPAIAEAYYQNLSLIIFTADRPKEWIDQADGQTIRQTNIFNNYIKSAFELPVETAYANDLWNFSRTVTQAIDTSVSQPAGPVQINVPLREPLYLPLPEQYSEPRLIQTFHSEKSVSSKYFKYLQDCWIKLDKKLVIFGINSPDPEITAIAQLLSERTDCIVFAENLSNISGPKIISTLEPFMAALAGDEKKILQPDLLITIGDSLVSKRTKQFLRDFAPKEQWQIDASAKYVDTFKCLNRQIEADVVPFLKQMIQIQSNATVNYALLAIEKKEMLNQQMITYRNDQSFTDIHIFSRLLEMIPPGTVLHFSNSTPVRYSQLFHTRSDIFYYCNRGTSGIDGCVSTAVGSAFISGKPTVLITGDLAFIYDTNAFWNSFVSNKLKVIVMNNNGGNIFSLIDSGPELEQAKKFFETPHQINLAALSTAYGIDYQLSDDYNSLEAILPCFVESKGPKIMEIKTNAEANTQAFTAYYQYLKQATLT